MAVGKDILRGRTRYYINGGEKDIAYANGMDPARIDKVPVAMANLDVGHGGTLARQMEVSSQSCRAWLQ